MHVLLLLLLLLCAPPNGTSNGTGGNSSGVQPYHRELLRLLSPGSMAPRMVTPRDVELGHRWATYLYPLPPKFNAHVWVKFGPVWAANRLRCLTAPCNASALAPFGIWYTDYAAEVPLLMKLLAALRFVDHPARADLFLVPALISLLGVPGKGKVGAAYLVEGAWFRELEGHLRYAAAVPARPHLFLATRDPKFLPAWVNNQTHVVTYGPGNLVVPSLNPLASLQPRNYHPTPAAQRDVLVLAAFSLIYPIRTLLHQQLMAYKGPATVERHFFHRRTPGGNLMELLARSVFVLCPPGDLPFQKRFFDALLNGAIPVVISRQCVDGVTWYGHIPSKYLRSCPASPRLVNDSYPALPVPWASLVVEFELDTVLLPGFNIVDQLVAVPKAEVEQKLARIAAIRHRFVYDYEGTTADAFSAFLQTLCERLRLGSCSAGS
eukprot:EG_transcript_12882